MTGRQTLVGVALVIAGAAAAVLLLDHDGGLVGGAAPVHGDRADQPAMDVHGVATGDETGDLVPDAMERLSVELAPVDPGHEAAETEFDPTGTVTGLLVDPTGRPVTGEPVDLLAARDPWRGERHPDATHDVVDRTTSDDEGRFTLAARPGASHQLYAGGRRHPRERVGSVGPGDDLTIALRDARWFTGVVVERETGFPVAGARVGAHSGDDRSFVHADEHGRFELGPVQGALAVLTGFAPGYDVALTGQRAPDWGEVTIELPPGHALDGRVIDVDSEEPVPGAAVTFRVMTETRPAGEPDPLQGRRVVEDWLATTDDDGRFTVKGLPSRAFRVIVEAEGYRVSTTDRYFGSAPDFEEVLVIGVVPARGLPGIVRRDLAPAPGVTVTFRTDEQVLASTLTDDEGRFTVPTDTWDGLGPLSLEALAPDGAFARARVPEDGLDQTTVLDLVAPFPVTALVRNRAGPLGGAHVLAWSQDAEPTIVLADAEGRARFEHRMAGTGAETVWLQARAGDVLSTAVGVEVEGGPPTEPVVLDVDDGAWFEGVVLDPDGFPVVAANVWMSGGRFTRSDEDGRFLLGPTRLPDSGLMTLGAWAEGHRKGEWKDMVPAEDLVLTLERVVSWAGRALAAATGIPLDSVAGRLQVERHGDGGPRWEDSGVQGRRTGEAGAFEVDLPGPGRYRLQALADGFITTESEPVDFDGVRAPPATDLFLSQAAMLEVVVQDNLGAPVRGYLVWLVPWDRAAEQETPAGVSGDGLQRQLTDTEGVTRFNLAQGGQLRLASGPGAWIDGGAFSVAPGETAHRRVHVPTLGGLDVTLRDHRDQPVKDVKVTLRSVGEERVHTIWRQGTLREAHELIEVRDLPEGEYAFVAEHDGFETVSAPFTVVGGRNGALRVDLEPRPRAGSDG